MSEHDSCRDCIFCKCVDITDTTGLKATSHICGRTGTSTVFHRAPFDTLGGLTQEPSDWCGPDATQFVARAL